MEIEKDNKENKIQPSEEENKQAGSSASGKPIELELHNVVTEVLTKHSQDQNCI